MKFDLLWDSFFAHCMLFIEGDLVSEIVPLLEGDDGDRVGLENGDLWVCHFLEDVSLDLDMTTDGIVAKE